jgi:hypothetical protein
MFYFLAYLPGLSGATILLPLFQHPTDPRVVAFLFALASLHGRLVHSERQSTPSLILLPS